MALKTKQQLRHEIARWLATSPELDSWTDSPFLIHAVFRRYGHQIDPKVDFGFVVDELIRTLREMVKLDQIEARCEAQAIRPEPVISVLKYRPKRRRRRTSIRIDVPLPLFDQPKKGPRR